jgi:2-polyprenyl-3-methyl-5-hydroxy-6-metoxy-1,4-benzoquinol methylase
VSRAPVATREVPCPLCGEDGAEHHFTAVDRLHGVPGRYTYVRCRDCSLVYMNPQVRGDLSPLYPTDYEPFRAPKPGEQGRGGISSYVGKLPVLARLAREALSVTMVDDWVAANLSPQDRWLDVGCGSGAFLLKVRERVGCEVVGLDIAQEAVEVARAAGLDAHVGTLETLAPSLDSFDVVSGWWYLEHVENPREVVDRIRGLLRDDGLCILAVPNVASPIAGLFRTRWYHLDAPRHLTLWSPRTMRRLLAASGFAVQRVRFDKSTWGVLGSLSHAGVPLPQTLAPGLLPLTIVLGSLHLSDTIVVYARKASS